MKKKIQKKNSLDIESKKLMLERRTSKIILYESPENIDAGIKRKIASYFRIAIFFYILYFIFLGVTLIIVYKRENFNFSTFILIPIIYHSLKVILNFIYFFFGGFRKKYLKTLKMYFILDLIYSLSLMILNLGIILYLYDILEKDKIIFFCIPLILSCLINSFLDCNTFFLLFIDSIFNLLLALNFGNYITINYAIPLLAGYVFSGFILFFASIALFIWISVLICFCFIKNDKPIKYGGLCLGLIPLLIWAYYGAILFLITFGFNKLFNQNIIKINADPAKANKILFYTGIIIIPGGVITLFIFFFSWIYIKKYLEIEKIAKGEKISLHKFARDLKTNMIPTSTNFFKKTKFVENEEEENFKLDKCFMSYSNDAEILIQPCGHSGACTQCITQYLKNHQKCFTCRKVIDNILIIFLDEKTGEYMAKGRIEKV